MGAIGAIAPTNKKLWGRCPQIAPLHRNFVRPYVIFEAVKCTVKYDFIVMPLAKIAQILV